MPPDHCNEISGLNSRFFGVGRFWAAGKIWSTRINYSSGKSWSECVVWTAGTEEEKSLNFRLAPSLGVWGTIIRRAIKGVGSWVMEEGGGWGSSVIDRSHRTLANHMITSLSLRLPQSADAPENVFEGSSTAETISVRVYPQGFLDRNWRNWTSRLIYFCCLVQKSSHIEPRTAQAEKRKKQRCATDNERA